MATRAPLLLCSLIAAVDGFLPHPASTISRHRVQTASLKTLRETQRFEPSAMQRQQMKEVMERAEVMQKGWDTVCEAEPKFELMRQRCKVAPSTSFHRDGELGEGLFATETLKSGDVATLYPVQALTLGVSTAARVMPRSDEGWSQGYEQTVQQSLPGLRGLRIDADPRERQPGWLGHFANDAARLSEPLASAAELSDISNYVATSTEKANAALVPFGGAAPLLCLVTLRDVEEGEELLTHYGPACWLEAHSASTAVDDGDGASDAAAADADGGGGGGNDDDDDENDKRIAAVMEDLDMKRFYDELAGLTVAVSMEFSREAENLATILTYQLAGGELGSEKLADGNRKARREGKSKGKGKGKQTQKAKGGFGR